MFAYDGSWKVRLTYMKDQIIRSYCTSCYYTRPDQASSFFHEPCVHEVAAIMLLTSYLNDRDMTDTTDHSADVFLQNALNGKASQKNFRLMRHQMLNRFILRRILKHPAMRAGYSFRFPLAPQKCIR